MRQGIGARSAGRSARRHDGFDPLDPQRPARVDAQDARMRMRAAKYRRLQHERRLQIGDEAPLASQEALVLEAWNAGADHRCSAELRGEKAAILDDRIAVELKTRPAQGNVDMERRCVRAAEIAIFAERYEHSAAD